MATTEADDPLTGAFCGHGRGVSPLQARIAPWMFGWLSDPGPLAALIQQHGAPLHLHCPAQMASNVSALSRVADDAGIDLKIFFARKANKCLCYVDQAIALGIGVDTASANELGQCLDRGITGDRLVYSAAIKEDAAIDHALSCAAIIVIDNLDEWDQLAARTRMHRVPTARWAIRLRGFQFADGVHRSRFGVDVADATEFVRLAYARDPDLRQRLSFSGIHFHLDGSDPAQRSVALRQCIPLATHFRSQGHEIEFIDMGGGFPICYLQSASQWRAFHLALDRQLRGQLNDRVIADGFGLGRFAIDDRVVQTEWNYPYWQPLQAAPWLAQILNAQSDQRATIANLLARNRLRLHCEPGRALVDGCGMTVTRVAYRKRDQHGDWLIGLHMNRTHCRTTAADFSVDPIVLPAPGSGKSDQRTEPGHGYFVGAYCMEGEFITPRRMRFDHGIAVGDLVVFPNTAGYQMHFLESRSHQFDLPKNVVVGEGRGPALDPIEQLSRSTDSRPAIPRC